MAVAIACCIVGYFAYEYDASFDAIHKNSANIYRVSMNREFNKNIEKFGEAPLPLGRIVRENIKDVEKSVRFTYSWSNLKKEDDLFESKLAYVDPEFFDLFSFDFINGDKKSITDKSSLFINDRMSIRLFGSPDEALGKTITQVIGTEMKELKVAGVFKAQPMNSSFFWQESYLNFENVKDEFKDMDESDWRRQCSLFLQVSDPSRIPAIASQLKPYTENNNKVREDFFITEYVLDHFPEMAHNDRVNNVRSGTWDAPPQSAIIGSSIMGILILLIACFNLTNTAIAISSRRLKEIGIRKVMGGIRQQLILQFIGETMFICFVALIFGVFISTLLVEGWNQMWDFMRLTPDYTGNSTFVIYLVTVLFFTGLLAGSYPAFYISAFEPISILKGKAKFGGTNFFTKFLLAAQFSISLIAIVSAVAFWQNAKYQENYDLGFNIRGAAIAWLNTPDEVQAYKNALASNPKIVSMAGASSGIFSNRSHEPIKHDSRQVEVDIIDVGDNYLKTMNLTLVQGRDFVQDSETDKKESVIISQKLADIFEWKDPLGKEIFYKDSVKLYVAGVVKDVYTMGLWRELEPLMIRYIGPEKYGQIVVSAKDQDTKEVNEFMEARWKELFPYRLYNGRFLSEDFKEAPEVNRNILTMYAFLGIIAMLLSATGLFTLVSLNIIRRMKEIGVRKVMGASVANITRIINTEFFIILLVSSVLGSVASYFSIDALMGSIWRYYQASTAMTFVFGVALMLLISVLAVGYKIFNAASMNPVNTLRDE